jgi:hypothetical protein
MVLCAWVCGRIALGHWPNPNIDDPKYINSAAVKLFYIGSQFGIMATPLALGLTVLGLVGEGGLACFDKRRVGRGLILLVACVVLWGGPILIARNDPGRVFEWFMD